MFSAAPTSVSVKEYLEAAASNKSPAFKIPPGIIAAAATTSDNAAVTGAAGTELELECVAVGGNPAPRLTWYVGGAELASTLAQDDRPDGSGTRTSRSRLRLPVTRADHGGQVRCEAEHDALDAPLVGRATLNILFPPRVTASVSTTHDAIAANASVGLAEGQAVTLTCAVESNPPANQVTWRRSGSVAGAVLTNQATFTISPVSRDLAGSYECVAENLLGRSQPAAIQLQVQCKFFKKTNYFLPMNMLPYLS